MEQNKKIKTFVNRPESIIQNWINYWGLQKYERIERLEKADKYLKENFGEEDSRIVEIHYI